MGLGLELGEVSEAFASSAQFKGAPNNSVIKILKNIVMQ